MVEQSGISMPKFSTAKLSDAIADIPLSIHCNNHLSCPLTPHKTFLKTRQAAYSSAISSDPNRSTDIKTCSTWIASLSIIDIKSS